MLFRSKSKFEVDHKDLLIRIVRHVASRDSLVQAWRDRVLSESELAWCNAQMRSPQPAAWSQPIASSATPRREPVSLLSWWKSIRTSPAPEPAAPAGERWFSALK